MKEHMSIKKQIIRHFLMSYNQVNKQTYGLLDTLKYIS